MRSPLIALCRVLRRLPQFGVFIAFASALFAQAALADGTGKGNGSETGQGFGWGLGIAADFDLGGNRVTGAQIDTASARWVGWSACTTQMPQQHQAGILGSGCASIRRPRS